MVETNYGMVQPGVKFDNVTGPMYLLVGDTERSGPATVQYHLLNCSKVVLGTHRLYNGTECGTGCPVFGFIVEGGTDNALFYSQEISKAQQGIEASTEKNFQLWGFFGELDVTLPKTGLIALTTPRGYGLSAQYCAADPGKKGGWHEPVEIQSEIIFKYNDQDLTGSAAGTVQPPAPPEFMSTGASGLALSRIESPRYLQKANYGAAALAAGADPLGKRSSSAAFEKVLAEKGALELPAGTFLIDRTIVLDVDKAERNGMKKLLAGQGMQRTIIRMTRTDVPAVKIVGGPAGRAKTDADVAPDQKLHGVTDATITGGKWGIDVTCFYNAAMRFVNVTITNSSQAGIMSGDGNVGSIAGTLCGSPEFDQDRFINVKCINTGDYGIYLNNIMIDKQFFLRCSFENLRKAGICANFTHMFNGSIL
jgi:hypothetical protein